MAYVADANAPQRWSRAWMVRELRRIADSLRRPTAEGIVLQQLHAEPGKVETGLTVLADGSDWNPGSGQGVYTYYNSQWNKLG